MLMEANGSTRKSHRREQLILALLQQPSLAKAAATLGMSSTTAWRMSKTPEFKEEYRHGAARGVLTSYRATAAREWRCDIRHSQSTCGSRDERLEPASSGRRHPKPGGENYGK